MAKLAAGLWFVMQVTGFEPMWKDSTRFETLHLNHLATLRDKQMHVHFNCSQHNYLGRKDQRNRNGFKPCFNEKDPSHLIFVTVVIVQSYWVSEVMKSDSTIILLV